MKQRPEYLEQRQRQRNGGKYATMKKCPRCGKGGCLVLDLQDPEWAASRWSSVPICLKCTAEEQQQCSKT